MGWTTGIQFSVGASKFFSSTPCSDLL